MKYKKDFISPREWQMAEAISKCKSNKEIASELNISERTVKFHVQNLLHKLGYTSRRELFYIDIAHLEKIVHVELRSAVVQQEQALKTVQQDLNRLLVVQEKSRELLEKLRSNAPEIQESPRTETRCVQ
jgi:DNA-binding CsgD family transcriptional regulator